MDNYEAYLIKEKWYFLFKKKKGTKVEYWAIDKTNVKQNNKLIKGGIEFKLKEN